MVCDKHILSYSNFSKTSNILPSVYAVIYMPSNNFLPIILLEQYIAC